MIENYVTGSSGFLGKRLSAELKKTTPIPHKEISTITLKPFNCFYFLSAYGNMVSQTDNNKIVKANVLDPLRMIKQASKFDFKSFVFISSSAVKLKYQTMYSRTKKATEEILLAYAEKGFPIIIIRPYSITGEGEQPQRLIPTLIRSCLTGEQMKFVPDAVHDFIDIEDIVEAITNLVKNRARGIFELGTGIGYTNQQVLEVVEDVTGKKANTVIVNKMRDYDSKDWVCKNYRARSFGWLPLKSLRQSIQEMVKLQIN